MIRIRKFSNSPRFQGVDERCAYEIDTAPWGGYDSGAANVLKDEDGVDVSDKLVGDPSTTNGIITTSVVVDLENEVKYRLEILWVKDGNTLEAYGELIGET